MNNIKSSCREKCRLRSGVEYEYFGEEELWRMALKRTDLREMLLTLIEGEGGLLWSEGHHS